MLFLVEQRKLKGNEKNGMMSCLCFLVSSQSENQNVMKHNRKDEVFEMHSKYWRN